MISHKYEDYSNRLGIHILDALVSVLFWPAMFVGILWWQRGVPAHLGALPVLTCAARNAISACFVIPPTMLICRQLKWFNVPFALDDPRRATMYPYAIYLVKFVLLGATLLVWAQLAQAYAPQLAPYEKLMTNGSIALMALGLPPYIYRIVTLWRRQELNKSDAADAA